MAAFIYWPATGGACEACGKYFRKGHDKHVNVCKGYKMPVLSNTVNIVKDVESAGNLPVVVASRKIEVCANAYDWCIILTYTSPSHQIVKVQEAAQLLWNNDGADPGADGAQQATNRTQVRSRP